MINNNTDNNRLTTCQLYDKNKSVFGLIKWKKELLQLQKEFLELQQLPNNSVFKFDRRPSVYLFINRIIHQLNTAQSFLGYNDNNHFFNIQIFIYRQWILLEESKAFQNSIFFFL